MPPTFHSWVPSAHWTRDQLYPVPSPSTPPHYLQAHITSGSPLTKATSPLQAVLPSSSKVWLGRRAEDTYASPYGHILTLFEMLPSYGIKVTLSHPPHPHPITGLPPFAPKIDIVQVDKGNAIFINWTVNSTLLRPVSSYELQVTGPSARNQTTPLTNTSYTLKVGVAQGQTYVFQVRALNVYGTGNYSDPRALMVPGHQMPWWVYLIIALLLLLALLLCCVLCCCLLCCCCKEKKTYDPRKYGRSPGLLTGSQAYWHVPGLLAGSQACGPH